jgi:hypothetical protein
MTQMAEIKSTATGGTVAANEARHYGIRHNEWLGRVAGATADARDATYLADVGGPVPGGPLDLGPTTGTDLVLGPFWGDPLKMLHIEGDVAGAVVYWCTGAGTPAPTWVLVLKAALDALAKKLQAAKRVLQEAAARAGAALGALARAIRAALLPILVMLLILAIIALLVVAFICVLGAPETFGLTLACSALGLAGAAAATVGVAALVGLSIGDIGGPLTSVFRAANPAIASAEPESGADYERDSNAAPSAIGSQASAASAVAVFNPGDQLLAAVSPLVDQLSDPLALVSTVVGSVADLDGRSIGRLNDAVAALDGLGDSVTASFIRGMMSSSGLDRPGAIALNDTARPEGAAADQRDV